MRKHKRSIEVIAIILLLLGISMSSTIIPAIIIPKDRVSAGFHEYSSDYIQYVSYIKEGMYGHLSMYFRSFPFHQPATPIHWTYIFFGIVFSPFGLSAPVIYHIVRIILGAIYIYLVYKTFLILFQKRHLALLSTGIAFTSSCFSWMTNINGVWSMHMLNYFPFSLSTTQRVTDRPHYILGSIIFLLVLHAVLQNRSNLRTYIFLCLASFATIMVHTPSGITLGLLSLYILIKNRWQGVSIALGCGIGALVTYYFVRQYSLVSDIFMNQYTYSVPFTFNNIFQEILSFGPLVWIGLPGLLLGRKPLIRMWGISHMLLFFVLYSFFHIDQVKFMQSLYFIPLTYGAVWFMWTISKQWKPIFFYIGVSSLLLVSLPMYLSQAYSDLFSMTDYVSYNTFGFPTTNQVAAYSYLDTHTPKESIVLASFEVANMLLMYSHNQIMGNDQGWSPAEGQKMRNQVDTFLSGVESEDAAYTYLATHHISYVYYGYQERTYGGDMSKYTFLKNVYENPEVIIYRVK